MQQAETIVLLLGLVAALVVISQKIHLPYSVVLVLAGLALSFVPHLPEVKLNPDVVFYFFLPALIYPEPSSARSSQCRTPDDALRRIQRDLDLAEARLTGT